MPTTPPVQSPSTSHRAPIPTGPDGTTPIERSNIPTQDLMTSGSFSEPAATGKDFYSTISDCISGLIDAVCGCFSHIIHFFYRNSDHLAIVKDRALLREVVKTSGDVLCYSRTISEMLERLDIAIAKTPAHERQYILNSSQILDLLQTQRDQQDGIRVWPNLELTAEAQTGVLPQQLLDDRATTDLFVKILTSISNAPDGLYLQILTQVIRPVLIRMRSTFLSQPLLRPIEDEQLPTEIYANAGPELFHAFNDMRNWAQEKLRKPF